MKRIEEIKKSLLDLYSIEQITKWEEKYPIVSNIDVEKWILAKIDQYTDDGKSFKKFTITSYMKPLQIFCNFHECDNPSEFLKEKIDDRNLRVKEFLMFLQKCTKQEAIKIGFTKNPSDVTIRNSIQSRIKSFYSERGSNISYKLKVRKIGANINEMVLDKEMLKLIFNKLGTNYKLIGTIQSQLGFRISDVLEELISKVNEKPKYVIERYKKYYFIRNFNTYKKRVIIPYVFFTPELSQMFISATGIRDLTTLVLTTLFNTKGTKKKKITNANFLNRLKIVVGDINLHGNIKDHCLRKYYGSQLDKVENVNKNFKEVLMGHEKGYSDATYAKNFNNIEWFFNTWKRFENSICVDCIVQVQDNTNEEILKLKKKQIKLKKQLKLSLKQNIDLTKKVETLTKDLPNLVEEIMKQRKQALKKITNGLNKDLFEESEKTK